MSFNKNQENDQSVLKPLVRAIWIHFLRKVDMFFPVKTQVLWISTLFVRLKIFESASINQTGSRHKSNTLWEPPEESQSYLQTGIQKTNELGANRGSFENVKIQERLDTVRFVYYE